MLNIYIGYDPRETVAYHTLAHSIVSRSSIPVSIAPVMLSQLGGLYKRQRGATESTEFSLSRFLVPALSGFKGWSLFMDCDMLCRTDIAALAAETAQTDKAVLVCKHDYVPKPGPKFLQKVQTAYPRKNWSSLVLFNNALCAALTPDRVNTSSGADLHRFTWLEDDSLIGALPLEWNWLVDEYEHRREARIVHFTRGGPWFQDFKDCDYADEWRDELKAMTHAG